MKTTLLSAFVLGMLCACNTHQPSNTSSVQDNIKEISQEKITPENRVAWFEDARMGMFIHWSVGSVTGARWSGEKLRCPTPYGEWLRCRNRIPRKEYDEMASCMSITQEKVDQWVKLAKEAGLKYVLFVAKHHDGLAFWPSEVSDYTFGNITNSHADVCQMLRNACDKYHMKLGFYYSHWQDWDDPKGWGNFWDFEKDPTLMDSPQTDEAMWSGALVRPSLSHKQFLQYWNQKAIPQVKELLQNYHPDILWFDMYVPRDKTIVTEADAKQLLDTIRSISPTCLVNSRLGIDKTHGDGAIDFLTMGDNFIPKKSFNAPWESSVTLNQTWGYNRDDDDWRSTTYFLRSIVNNISLGGNIQINIGPKGDGSIPRETTTRMDEIGKCIHENKGKGFYHCGNAMIKHEMNDWGMITKDLTDPHKVYLHVFDWPLDGKIHLNGIQSKIDKITVVSSEQNLSFTQVGPVTTILGPKEKPIHYDTVLEVELKEDYKTTSNFIGEKNLGGYYLSADNTLDIGPLEKTPADKVWIPSFLSDWTSAKDKATWTFFIPQSGDFNVRVCYSCSVETEGQEYNIILDDHEILSDKTIATSSSYKEYRAYNVRKISIDQLGYHKLSISPKQTVRGDLFHLAWIELK